MLLDIITAASVKHFFRRSYVLLGESQSPRRVYVVGVAFPVSYLIERCLFSVRATSLGEGRIKSTPGEIMTESYTRYW